MPSDPFYRSPLWRALRKATLERDRYRCTVPGCTDRATVADHIVSRRNGGADTLANLRSLCATHDGQVKEKPDGTRANNGKFKVVGCDASGWPLARQG